MAAVPPVGPGRTALRLMSVDDVMALRAGLGQELLEKVGLGKAGLENARGGGASQLFSAYWKEEEEEEEEGAEKEEKACS